MSTKVNYFKIGAFVIGTVLILIVGIIVLSAAALGRDVILLETYIDESVQGLSVGSPVMQRGVQIGTVKKITFVPREYKMKHGSKAERTYAKYVMVIMAIDKANFPDMPEQGQVKSIVQHWVDDGLRLKMAYQGITGIAYLESDFVDPVRYQPMKITWEPKHLYIPSAPSLLSSFTQSIDDVFQTLDHIDFEGLAESMDTALKSFDQAIKDVQVAKVRQEMLGLISEMRETNRLVVKIMDKSQAEPDTVNVPELMAQFSTTLKRMDQFVLGQKSEFEEIVANLRRASANLRELTEYVKKHPSQVLFGPPPARSEVVK